MKGTIVLSEGRSGTNWLGGLATSTGVLGNSGEWLTPELNKLDASCMTAERYVEEIIAIASGDTNYFVLKVFPHQHFRFHRTFQADAISLIKKRHNVQFLQVVRKDTIAQAISYVKAFQSKAWTAGAGDISRQKYDFDQICRAYFYVRRSNELWRSYTDLHQLDSRVFFYEELLPDGSSFIDALASHAGIENVRSPKAQHTIQRDKKSDEWRVRFLQDLENENVIPHTVPFRPPHRRLSNHIRLARGEYLKPFPYSF